MSVTLQHLIDDARLRLNVMVGRERGELVAQRIDASIEWAYSSSLIDPTPFLSAGQLLLTDGAQFTPDGDGFLAYVERLRAAGLVGIAFGTGLSWPEVPPALVRACLEVGMPLVEVPFEVPFLAVIRTVATLLEQQRQSHVLWGVNAQRAISRVALRSDRLDDLLEELARQLDCGAAIFDRSGQLLSSAGRRRPRQSELDELAPILERLSRTPTRSAARISAASGDEFIVQGIGVPPRLSGQLVLGGVGSLDGIQRNVVEAVLALAGVTLEFSRTTASQNQLLRGSLVQMAADGHRAMAEELAQRLWGIRLPDGECRVIALRTVPPTAAARFDRLLDAGGVFWGGDGDGGLVLCTSRRLDDVRHVCVREALVAGASVLASPDRLGALTAQARAAADRAEPGQLVLFEDVATADWPTLLQGSLLQVVAGQLLAPLESLGTEEAAELRRTLQAWLESNGQWEPAASRLGVHRHTVRNRVIRAQEVLGLDLESAEDRTRVWLALRLG